MAAADEPLGARVRKGKLEKLPYVLVVGDDDVRDGTVGVNSRGKDRPERGVPLADFITALRAEIDTPRPFTRRSVSSLERLWAGWRTAYVEQAAAGTGDGGCVFCAILASGLPDQETHVVWRHRPGWRWPSSTPTPTPPAISW